MGPVIQHLRAELPQPYDDAVLLKWTFTASLKELSPQFYNKILSLNPLLQIEYSIVCNQLHEDFLRPSDQPQIKERLITALMYCELLEHVYAHYLVVPREVVRLRKQQQIFRQLLSELAGFSFSSQPQELTASDFSFSQCVREWTIQMNWYRILINRSKRVINLLTTVVTDSQNFNTFVRSLDQYTNPFLAYFGLFFHVPRLLTNIFLTLKHTFPGSWMGKEEQSLEWTTRLFCQMQRRWFELGNDVVWTVVSALNIFVFIGSITVGGLYLSAAAFAFDAFNAAARAYVELKRLDSLRERYNGILAMESNEEQKNLLRGHLKSIEQRIHFEHLRFGLHVSGTVLIFAAMSIALPVFALNSHVILASAVFLLLLWLFTFSLTRQLEKQRPNETIESTARASQMGFFAKQSPKQNKVTETPNEIIESLPANMLCS